MAAYYVLYPESEAEGYGIRVITERKIADISPELAPIVSLVKTLNELALCPEHIDDIIEDFLSGDC